MFCGYLVLVFLGVIVLVEFFGSHTSSFVSCYSLLKFSNSSQNDVWSSSGVVFIVEIVGVGGGLVDGGINGSVNGGFDYDRHFVEGSFNARWICLSLCL